MLCNGEGSAGGNHLVGRGTLWFKTKEKVPVAVCKQIKIT